MNHDVVGQYLGFYVEAFGSQKQWEVNAEKVEAARGALLQLLGKHPLMTNEMRNAVYSAKVRSLALLGLTFGAGAVHIDSTKVIANLCVF